MTKLISVFFCVLFLNQLALNIWILVDFYINQEYISKNECVNRFTIKSACNGKCILSSRLKKYRKSTSSTKTPSCKKIEVKDFLCILIKECSILDFSTGKTDKILSFNSLYHYFYKASIFHPPRLNSFFICT